MSAHGNTDGIVALSSRARDIRAFRSLIYKVLEDVGHVNRLRGSGSSCFPATKLIDRSPLRLNQEACVVAPPMFT